MTRRDNGLTATAYAPLADIDPPLCDQVLDLLAAVGVAAKVEPAGQSDRLSLRVLVDRDRMEQARRSIDEHLPPLRATFLADIAARDDRAAMAEAEVDEAWQSIVAGYDLPADPVGRWSAAEDLDEGKGREAHEEPPRSGLSARLVRRAPRETPGEKPPVAPDGWDDCWEDPDDHFTPPPPPPLPEVHPVARLGWAGVVGGPVLILIIAVLGLQIEPWVILLALLAFCGGMATLVSRMRDRAPQDDGWDDGAEI